MDFSLSPFQVINLVDGAAFPGYAAQQLQFYDQMGERVTDNMNNDLLYLPFINFSCILEEVPSLRNIANLDFMTVDDPLKYVPVCIFNPPPFFSYAMLLLLSCE